MSHGTRKAIVGTAKAERFASEGVEEAIRRYDACQSNADIRDVLAWARARGGWFLRTADDEVRMRAAFHRAIQRAAPTETEGA